MLCRIPQYIYHCDSGIYMLYTFLTCYIKTSVDTKRIASAAAAASSRRLTFILEQIIYLLAPPPLLLLLYCFRTDVCRKGVYYNKCDVWAILRRYDILYRLNRNRGYVVN